MESLTFGTEKSYTYIASITFKQVIYFQVGKMAIAGLSSTAFLQLSSCLYTWQQQKDCDIMATLEETFVNVVSSKLQSQL